MNQATLLKLENILLPKIISQISVLHTLLIEELFFTEGRQHQIGIGGTQAEGH